MKNLFITGCIIAHSLIGYAQESVNSSGGNGTSPTGSVSYSAGQVVYQTYSAGGTSVAQGVQQPYEISTSYGAAIKGINLAFSAYPNPTLNDLILEMDQLPTGDFQYEMSDIQGKILDNKTIHAKKITIPMADLPASTYLLNIIQDKTCLKTFKIVKN